MIRGKSIGYFVLNRILADLDVLNNEQNLKVEVEIGILNLIFAKAIQIIQIFFNVKQFIFHLHILTPKLLEFYQK